MTTNSKLILAAAILCAVPLLSANTVYQWTDENGVVHFSQLAPGEKAPEAVETNLRSAPKTGGTFVPPAAEPEQNAKTANAVVEQPAPAYTKSPERCAQGREMLATLATGQRIRLRDPETGEIVYASEEDVAEQRSRANAAIERDC